MNMISCYLALLALLPCFLSIPVLNQNDPLKITVVHINDIHAHIEEIKVNTTRCRVEDGQVCYGGVARLAFKKNEIFQQDPEALFLNAGDFYQGELFLTDTVNMNYFQELFGIQSLNIIQ